MTTETEVVGADSDSDGGNHTFVTLDSVIVTARCAPLTTETSVHRWMGVLAKTATALPNGAGSASLNGAAEALRVWHRCRTWQRWTPRTGVACGDRHGISHDAKSHFLGDSPKSQESVVMLLSPAI